MSEPIDNLFSTSEMSSVFSAKAHVRGMLAFEAALAHAEAIAGIIPQEVANTIAANCKVELFELRWLAHPQFLLFAC